MTLVTASKKLIKFDPKRFLSTINGGWKIEAFAKQQTIFAQGDSSDAVFYIQEGKVKLPSYRRPESDVSVYAVHL
jgi:CRP-like cAMP-binding protein